MKLTLESQAVEVALADPRFPLARVWKGRTEDGREIMALIAFADRLARIEAELWPVEREDQSCAA